MYLFHSWKSSLQLFKPSNLKLFLLVTLKSTLSSYKAYFRYGWPLLTMAAGAIAVFGYTIVGFAMKYGSIAAELKEAVAHKGGLIGALIFTIGLLSFICRFLAAVCARPSVAKKDGAYVASYFKRYFLLYILLGIVLMFILALGIFMPILCLAFLYGNPEVAAAFFQEGLFGAVMNGLMLVPVVFSLFFLLDLEPKFVSAFKASWLGIKMACYNLPFVLFTGLLLGLWSCLSYITFLGIFLYPVIFCFIGNYYTKKVHDQARLYLSK